MLFVCANGLTLKECEKNLGSNNPNKCYTPEGLKVKSNKCYPPPPSARWPMDCWNQHPEIAPQLLGPTWLGGGSGDSRPSNTIGVCLSGTSVPSRPRHVRVNLIWLSSTPHPQVCAACSPLCPPVADQGINKSCVCVSTLDLISGTFSSPLGIAGQRRHLSRGQPECDGRHSGHPSRVQERLG